MANKVTFTMNNAPAGLDSMYVRVEEDALTAGVRNVLHSGVQAVTGNTIDIDIGENGTVGNGAIISADNYTSGGAAFKSMTGYALIEASTAPPVVADYENIVFVGASIIEGSFGRDLTTPNTIATQEFRSAGINVDVYGYGFSGATASEIASNLLAAMSSFTDKTLFIVHGGGNDVTSNRPFSGMTQPAIDTVSADYQTLVDAAATRSDDCMLCNITFRPYSDGRDSTVFNDESLGSRPFNDNILLPKIAQSLPSSINVDGNCVIDLYNWSRNEYKKLIGADGIHPNDYGDLELIRFMSDRVGYLFSGSAKPAPIIPRDAITFAVNVQDAINGGQINQLPVEDFNSGLNIPLNKDFGSTEIVNLSISSTAAGLTTSYGATSPSSIYFGDLDFNAATKNSIYIEAGESATFTYSLLEPNKDYVVKFLGSRVAVDTRVTRFTIGQSFVDVNTSPDPAEQPKELTATADSNGELVITMTVQEGSHGYINAIQVRRIS